MAEGTAAAEVAGSSCGSKRYPSVEEDELQEVKVRRGRACGALKNSWNEAPWGVGLLAMALAGLKG